MGWGDWFRTDSDNEVSSKVEKHSDGSRTEHHLGTKGGSRNDHSHVVVNKDSSGKTTSAHGNTNKSKRK